MRASFRAQEGGEKINHESTRRTARGEALPQEGAEGQQGKGVVRHSKRVGGREADFQRQQPWRRGEKGDEFACPTEAPNKEPTGFGPGKEKKEREKLTGLKGLIKERRGGLLNQKVEYRSKQKVIKRSLLLKTPVSPARRRKCTIGGKEGNRQLVQPKGETLASPRHREQYHPLQRL